jgi:GNAT superfamily N-acetyltransferase
MDETRMTELNIRALTLDDAPTAAQLSASVGWTHTVETWQQTIEWASPAAWGLQVGTALVGSAVALEYSTRLAWIGNVIVHPDQQKRGYARRLVEHAIAFLRERKVQAIMLDASAQGFPLYQSMNFRILYPIQTWVGKAAHHAPQGSAIRLMTAEDCAAVTALEASVIGVARPQVIAGYWTPSASWVWDEGGTIKGYLLARWRGKGWFLGPSYHVHPEGAEGLYRTAIHAFAGHEVRADVPALNDTALQLMASLGMQREDRHITRMILDGEAPGHMEQQYSVGSFTTG